MTFSHPFERMVYERFAASIAAWDVERHPDIYAVSLLRDSFGSRDAEGRYFAGEDHVWLSFNTESHYRSQVARASSPEEARWNFAFWLQDFTAAVPRDFHYGEDPPAHDLALRDDWLASLGIPPTGTDGGGRPTYDGRIEDAVRGLCERVARALHENGVIVARLGRAVPILVHGLEKSDEDVAVTLRANPPGLADGFADWSC